MRILARTGYRYFLRHRWQLLLAVAGVAIGVAIVVAIDQTTRTAERSFERAARSIAGRTTHEIVGPESGFDERVYVDLRTRLGERRAAPVVQGFARLLPDSSGSAAVADGAAGNAGRTVRVLGVDVFAEAPLREALAFENRGFGERFELAAFLTEPGAVVLARGTAGDLGLDFGDRAAVRINGREHPVRVVGLLDPADPTARLGFENVLVADVATAQELLGRVGRLDRIDLVLPDGARGDAALERIRGALPRDLEVRPAGVRAGGLRELTRSFRVNLQALGLLALMVGAFLIYNTMSFAVVQRRETFGTLRALGASRRQIWLLVLGEASVIGAVGVALGLGFGILLAGTLLGLVTQTINDFWTSLSVAQLEIDAWLLVRTAAAAFGVCLLAALVPALEATLTQPRTAQRRSELEARSRHALTRVTLCGIALAAAGAIVLTQVERNLVVAFVALFALLFGLALAVPAGTVALLALVHVPLRGALGSIGSLIVRGARASLSRTGVAVAALTVAVASTVGIGAMIDGFRASVERWLRSAFVADVYVAVPRAAAALMQTRFEPDVLATLLETPGVAGAITYRWTRVDCRNVAAQADGSGAAFEPEQLTAVEGGELASEAYRPVRGDPERVLGVLRRGGAVLVSEPFAFRRRLDVGDAIELRTDRGWRRFSIAGVFRDYGSQRGFVVMNRATYDGVFDDRGVSSLALFAAAGVASEDLASRARARVAATGQDLSIRSNRSLYEVSLDVFDRTFAITEVMRLLCVLVAFLGVGSALTALELERAGEIGVLRALGATPRQVWGLVVGQAGLLGVCAGVLALPIGAVLAYVLIHVINRQSFGWTLLDASVPPGSLALAVVVATAAAVGAGLLPARSLSRGVVARSLREE